MRYSCCSSGRPRKVSSLFFSPVLDIIKYSVQFPPVCRWEHRLFDTAETSCFPAYGYSVFCKFWKIISPWVRQNKTNSSKVIVSTVSIESENPPMPGWSHAYSLFQPKPLATRVLGDSLQSASALFSLGAYGCDPKAAAFLWAGSEWCRPLACGSIPCPKWSVPP